jgi:hypothetical protein
VTDQRAAPEPAVVERSAEQQSVLDLDGEAVNPLGEASARVTVLFFIRADCPISNRYAPEIRRLFEAFRSKGIGFWLVYPDPDATPESIRQHLDEYSYSMPAVRDTQHYLVNRAGASITPEAAVFDSGGKCVYVGRIDNWYSEFGKARTAPTEHDLQRVLAAVLEGRLGPFDHQPAVGCYISDLKPRTGSGTE